jgi:hypothetical protein
LLHDHDHLRSMDLQDQTGCCEAAAAAAAIMDGGTSVTTEPTDELKLPRRGTFNTNDACVRMSRREQAPSWSVHNRKESEHVGRATDSSPPSSHSPTRPSGFFRNFCLFVCLFVAKVAIVQRNMWKKTCGYRPLGRFLSQIWL